jgi:hypothetical protein
MINKLSAYPNPFLNNITIEISTDMDDHAIVRLRERKGRIVRMFSWNVAKGSNLCSLNDLDELKSGDYILDAVNEEGIVLGNAKVMRK